MSLQILWNDDTGGVGGLQASTLPENSRGDFEKPEA